MGLETAAILAIGSMAMAGVTTFVSIQQANSQAEAAGRAANATFVERDAELTRQQDESNRLADEDRSDVVRRADQELGSLRVAMGELGASATSQAALLSEIGAVEGINLGRIEGNRKNSIESLQAGKRAAKVGYNNTVTQAYNQAKASNTNALLNFAATGLQIGGGEYARQQDASRATNAVT